MMEVAAHRLPLVPQGEYQIEGGELGMEQRAGRQPSLTFVANAEASQAAYGEIPRYAGFCANANGDLKSVPKRNHQPRRKLYGPKGEPIPFSVMDAVFETIANGFPDRQEWEQIGIDARLGRVQGLLSQAFREARLPPLTIILKDAPQAAGYYHGKWTMLFSPAAFASEARDQVLHIVSHECQHALQEFLRLSWLAGRYKGPLSIVNERQGLKGRLVDGERLYGTDAVWKIAQAHPTATNLYIENLVRGLRVDREYEEALDSAATDNAKDSIVRMWYGVWDKGRMGDPHGGENNAEEAAWNTVACERLMKR